MNPDEQKIRSLVALWHRATALGDVATVLSLVKPDVVFLTPGAPPMNGKVSFENGLREVLKSHRIDSTAAIIECAVSDQMAYCLTQLTATITPLVDGKAKQRSGYALSVFQKQPDGSWLLARDANLLSSAPEA